MRSVVRCGLVAVAAAVVLWIRLQPLALDGVTDASALRYRGEDGREHVYLGDFDSYLWLRYARNVLRTGTTCDAVVDGECRDTYANAPVGRRMRYARSLHVAAIVAMHRLIGLLSPEYPLTATAFWVPVLVGMLGTVPAFLIGERLGGPLGGFAAALLVGTNPLVLQRTIGSDDDVWNVVLPLCVAAAGAAATAAVRPARQAAWAGVAAVFVGLHAATWSGWAFTYVVVLVALVGNAFLLVLRLATRGGRVDGGVLMRGLVPVAVFYLAGAFFAALAGSPEGFVAPLHAVGSILGPHEVADVPGPWPDVLATVTELVRPDLRDIAAGSGEAPYFFVGWLGLLLLWLPRSRWHGWHLAVMTGGNLLYYYLLTGPQLERSVLVAMLAAPVAIAIVLAAATGRRRQVRDAGAALILTVWFLGALDLAYGGTRFVLLLVPPAAVACAVAIGRLHLWLTDAMARVTGSPRRVLAPLLFGVVAAALVPAVARGVAAARSYVPEMDDAWWDTLTHIREAAPPDAIVNTWWDYGHWATSVAERRVSADGASLLTHVPYWLARALLATSEAETVGLLRMLNCGSDATPEPEGRLGAYGKLVARGVDAVGAPALVVALAGRDRPAARALLVERGLAPADVEDVLASTHCTSPPAYLVVATRLARMPAIRQLANWDFERPDAPRAGSPTLLEFEGGWRPCEATARGTEWTCAPPEHNGCGLGEFRYRLDAPEESRFLTPEAGGDGLVTPAVVVLAEAAGRREVRTSTATEPELAVLVDVLERRALVGPADLLRSTLVELLYLDGCYAPQFEKFDERVGYAGERVMTWRLRDAP